MAARTYTRAEIIRLVITYAEKYRIDSLTALAQINQESRFNQFAKSPSGAQGIAQFMPATAKRFGLKDPFDPPQALDAWGRYMTTMQSMFNHRLDITLAGYNSGENRKEYKSAAAQGRAINWGVLPARVQHETKAYVETILGQTAQINARNIFAQYYGEKKNSQPVESSNPGAVV